MQQSKTGILSNFMNLKLSTSQLAAGSILLLQFDVAGHTKKAMKNSAKFATEFLKHKSATENYATDFFNQQRADVNSENEFLYLQTADKNFATVF